MPFVFLPSPDPEDRWSLRPGDLPPPDVLEAEPRLRGLENNAVFRLLTNRARRRPIVFNAGLAAFYGVFGAMQCFPMSLTAPSPVVRSLFRVGIFASLAFAAWALFRKRLNSSPPPPFAIFSPRELSDLILAGVPPRDIAIALWGARLSARRLRPHPLPRFATISIAVALLLGQWSFGPSPPAGTWIVLWGLANLVLFMEAFASTLSTSRVEPALAGTRDTLKSLLKRRGDLRAAIHPGRIFVGAGVGAILLFAVIYTVAAVVRRKPLLLFLTHPFLSLAATPVAGAALGRAASRRPDEAPDPEPILEEAAGYAAELMETSRAAIFETA